MSVQTQLKNFQKRTVRWMIKQEKENGGGLLLNEPGTGKSICCLDLILKTTNIEKVKNSKKVKTVKKENAKKVKNEKEETEKQTQKTLVLCPSGLVMNWVNEIKKHTNLTDKNIFVYTGKNRELLQKTNDHMIYVSSYSLVTREFVQSNQTISLDNSKSSRNFKENSLFNDVFSRIILDEAHYIRNRNQKVFKSVSEIQSKNKWVVTATPIFNNVDDMYTYLNFLGIGGFDTFRDWRRVMTSIDGYKTLNKLMSDHSIKLLKSEVLKDELHKKEENNVYIEMSGFEKQFYENLWSYSMTRIVSLDKRLKKLSGLNDINSKDLYNIITNNILVYILRLKQACNSPWLVISKMNRLKNVKTLESASKILEYHANSVGVDEECPVCYDNMADTIASPCGHKCCHKCWGKIMNSLKKCPMCRTEIDYIENVNDIREEANGSNVIDVESKSELSEMSLKESSKIKALVELIRSKTEKGEKVIVVSQWVNMLEIAREIVNIHFPDIKSVCLKGEISMNKRTQIIDNFQNDSSIKICYISLMSSAEGINLTSANNMILLDTWWNNSKMIQVCDRIHRIGQKSNVNIYRLRVGGCNSIEERINKLVLRKDHLKNMIMNKWNSENPDNFEKILSSSVKLIG